MSNPIIDKGGVKRWLNEKGQKHRTDGPAIIFDDGVGWWYQNGKRHRIDGPAIIYPDGMERWFINGKEVPKIICLLSKKLNE